jgi:hypothetical protein
MDLDGQTGPGEIFDIHGRFLSDEHTQTNAPLPRQRLCANTLIAFVNRLEILGAAVHDAQMTSPKPQ